MLVNRELDLPISGSGIDFLVNRFQVFQYGGALRGTTGVLVNKDWVLPISGVLGGAGTLSCLSSVLASRKCLGACMLDSRLRGVGQRGDDSASIGSSWRGQLYLVCLLHRFH